LQGFSCEKCLNKNENVKKYFKISGKLPKILTIHLKRFQGGIGKILKKVKF
jgi:ubiquitin C-terminal hydrolase